MSEVKEEAINLIKSLPEHVSWDDLMYEFYVRKKISISLQAEKERKILSHDEVKK